MTERKIVNLTVHKNTKEKRRRKDIIQDCIDYIKENKNMDGISIVAFKRLDEGIGISRFHRAIDDELYASVPYMVYTAFSNMIK